MIRYENVHKVFGTVDVLKGISFEIPTGKVVCILGPSGSGKTTLLRCTNYLETPTQGIITVGDKSTPCITPKRTFRKSASTPPWYSRTITCFGTKTRWKTLWLG